jgi:hypothetical protein
MACHITLSIGQSGIARFFMISLDSVKDDILLLFLDKRRDRRTSITRINNRILEHQDIFD